MRRVTTLESVARIVLGGRILGSQGFAPGVLEEAWMSLALGPRPRVSRPLFVVGGFGGCAQVIAEVLGGRSTAEVDEALASDVGYAELSAKEGHPGPVAMLDQFRDSPELRHWLSVTDQQILLNSSDPLKVVDVILQGLRRVVNSAT
jgi:SLOG cluster2